MGNDSIREICVVGEGTLFLFCLLALRLKLVPFGISVRGYELVGKEEKGVVHIGRGMQNLFSAMAFDTPRLLAHSKAMMLLGEEYQLENRSWIHTYGEYGEGEDADWIWRALFATLEDRESISKIAQSISLASQAILAGKFAIPAQAAESFSSLLDFGAVLSRADLNNYFRRLLARAAVHIELLPDKNSLETDDVASVINAYSLPPSDFWIDCLSDRHGEDVGSSPSQENYLTNIEWLVEEDNTVAAPLPAVVHKKMSSGWLSIRRTQSSTSYRLLAYEEADEKACKAEFGLTDSREIERCYINESPNLTPWVGNTLRLRGLIPRLVPVGDDIASFASALFLFIENLPLKSNLEKAATLFTYQWNSYAEEFQDYALAHRCLTFVNSPVSSGTVCERLECFRAIGKVRPLETDAVTKSDWFELMAMNYVFPEKIAFLKGDTELDSARSAIVSTAARLKDLCAEMPYHQQFIDAMKLHVGD